MRCRKELLLLLREAAMKNASANLPGQTGLKSRHKEVDGDQRVDLPWPGRPF